MLADVEARCTVVTTDAGTFCQSWCDLNVERQRNGELEQANQTQAQANVQMFGSRLALGEQLLMTRAELADALDKDVESQDTIGKLRGELSTVRASP